ncbi:hypothetical protein [Jiulongibacter sediminis]|uniref:hypothetical protein n=1 Tax=Jiulongibacter sediminis TaxID=1605367 RepID=UPI0026EB26B6|nr:hypothetical protein [Jiulongibacter sediminis]
MRKILLLIFLPSVLIAQRRRMIEIDDNLTTPATTDYYGLAAKNDSLYLVNSSGVAKLVGSADLSVVVDTLEGRAVFRLPTHIANLIPDSSHFVIEPDFIKARSSGNSYYDTLRADYFHYNILKDSVEIFLPDFSGVFNSSEVYFYIHFFGSDDDDSLFVHDENSILYFSDTIYFYNPANQITYQSNYLSSGHSVNYFSLEPNQTFNLVWIHDENKYYIK